MPGAEFLLEFEKIKNEIEVALDKANAESQKKSGKKGKITIEHKHELSHKHEVRYKVEITVITALIAALAFIIALSWNEAIKQITQYFLRSFLPEIVIELRFLEATIITLVCVLGIYVLTRLQVKVK